jgi:hypothetical protein
VFQVFVSLVTVYMRRRYIKKHLYWTLRSEFESTQMQEFARTGVTSVQQSARPAADVRRSHVTPSSPVSTRHVHTEIQRISSTNVGGHLRRRAHSHGSQAQLPDESHHQHAIVHGSPLTPAVSLRQTQPEHRHIRP